MVRLDEIERRHQPVVGRAAVQGALHGGVHEELCQPRSLRRRRRAAPVVELDDVSAIGVRPITGVHETEAVRLALFELGQAVRDDVRSPVRVPVKNDNGVRLLAAVDRRDTRLVCFPRAHPG